ncbi:MAG: DUF2157 domain-containing protein [Gemmatimonadetes bacterium]|nr:DUF2157 domain-containing protein [Gemmatimonadota bacterium]
MDNRELLNLGVERGIITDDQRTQLQVLLGREDAGAPVREAERGFNGVAIAYLIGAIVVLFAFGWFMVDRWKVLGDGGLFGLAAAYAAIFLGVGFVMKREGFHVARGVATLLAVGMAPIAMWALLRWIGVWTPEYDAMCVKPDHPFAACQGQPMAVELAAVVAALVAMRQMAFSPFMIPIAVVSITLPERVMRELAAGPAIDGAAMGWRWIIIASLLSAAAYLTDRRRRGEEDYAFWLWMAVAAAAWFGGLMLFQMDHSLRWYLAPASLLVITASVILRRRALLVVGLFGVFGFLAWLAFDVFKVTTAFPLVLALIGVAIIVLTVWVQKRFPEVIRRVGGDPSQPARFPGGVAALLAPALLGMLLMNDAARVDREAAADRRSHMRARNAASRNRKLDGERRQENAQPAPADTSAAPAAKRP